RPLAPAAPLQMQLPRGLASMIPLSLWLREDRPVANEGEIAAFGEREALEYSLDDRGARLLAVLRAHSLLRWFFPPPVADPHALLTPALCMVAEDPSPLALREAIETLLAGWRDGNAALLIATEQAARRYLPPLSLG